MSWSYYPDGKLKSHGDDGVPVGSQSTVVDDSDTGATTATGTWATDTTAGDAQGEDARTHAAAAAGSTGASDSFTWTLDVPADGTYDLAATWPTETGAASDATYTLTTGTGSSAQSKDYNADQTSSAGAWNDLASVALTKGEQVTLTLKPSATGVVSADAVRLVRDASADTDNEHKAFAYSYDLNGNLTGINDTSSDTGVDEYTMAYDGLDQITSVKEALAGQEKDTTSYTYDSLGDPLTVKHPDQDSTYTYDDPRHLLTKVSVDDLNDPKGAKDTSYTYDLLGRVQTETKGNGNVVSYDYQPDSAVLSQTERKAPADGQDTGDLVASHDYTYDANGDQFTDDAKKRSGDDASTVLDSDTTYTYDPVDRIETKTKTGHASSSESYVHDANANVTSQVIDSDTTDTTPGDETTFTYDRNRLTTAVTNPGTSGEETLTSSYRYDAFGRETSAVADVANADPKTISRTTYDGFDHIKTSEKVPQGSTSTDLVTTNYTYDPLDRRTSETTHAGTDEAKTTAYSYLGLSSELISEQGSGQLTKTYQYSPWGERLSQISQQADSGKGVTAGETAYYGYNSHTDVETLTNDDGSTIATYGYTAYGQQDDAETTGIDALSPTQNSATGGATSGSNRAAGNAEISADDATTDDNGFNVYRYNADRWDSSSQTYDMGFRDYAPSLNTFTTRDSYNGSLDDLALGADPYTSSRYAYGAGNPISMVEIDGHDSAGHRTAGDRREVNPAYGECGFAGELCPSDPDSATSGTEYVPPKPEPAPQPSPAPDTSDGGGDGGSSSKSSPWDKMGDILSDAANWADYNRKSLLDTASGLATAGVGLGITAGGAATFTGCTIGGIVFSETGVAVVAGAACDVESLSAMGAGVTMMGAGGNEAINGAKGMKAPPTRSNYPSMSQQIKKAGLPTSGKIRFVPPKGLKLLQRGKRKGYIDRFGNEWVKGPSRTSGEPFEWDVQLGRGATEGLTKFTDGSHANVSLEGRITH